VKVRNIAFQKVVRLHYLEPGSTWRDFDLPWTANYGDHDIFSSGVAPYTEEFVISFSVGSQTYWDNNASRNYIASNFHSAVGGSVSLRRARLAAFASFQRNLSGEIYVENLSYNKTVGVRMQPFGLSEWIDVEGHYAGLASEGGPVSLGPVELWNFRSPIFNTGGFQFAAFYHDRDSGAMYWDSNFGQNYRLSTTPEVE